MAPRPNRRLFERETDRHGAGPRECHGKLHATNAAVSSRTMGLMLAGRGVLLRWRRCRRWRLGLVRRMAATTAWHHVATTVLTLASGDRAKRHRQQTAQNESRHVSSRLRDTSDTDTPIPRTEQAIRTVRGNKWSGGKRFFGLCNRPMTGAARQTHMPSRVSHRPVGGLRHAAVAIRSPRGRSQKAGHAGAAPPASP